MPIEYFDKLIDNYIPTDAGWFYHPDNAVPLETTVDENGNLVSDGDISLLGGNVPFEQIGFTTVGDGTNNQKVYYLSVISADAGATPMAIITDMGASNAKALQVTGPCTMLFKTAYPYNKDTLKKVTVRLKSTVAGDIRVGLAGMQDEAYFSPTGAYSFDSFYEIAVSASNVPSVDGTYHTIVGYFKETLDIPTGTYPTLDPNHPCALLTGTTDIAMAIKCTSGEFLIDSIDIQENVGALFEVPGGQAVLNTLSDLADDNKITPAEKTYIETQWNAITHEYGNETTTGLYFNAVTSGINPITLSNYKGAYDALWAYLYDTPDGIMLDVSITSDIKPVIYGSMFSDYFTAKASLNDEYNSIVYALSLTASSYTFSIYRGVYSVNTITLTLTAEHITAPSVLWTCSDGALTKVDDTHYTLDCTTVVGDQAMIEVSGVGGGDTYTHTLGIAKVVVASTPYNFGGVTEVPTLIPTNAKPIVDGDYFLWALPNPVLPLVNSHIYGAIYEYNGTTWDVSTNGDLVMTMFDSFANLANDVDSQVMGNVVIKNLVAIKAFIDSLMANYLEVKELLYAKYTKEGVAPVDGSGFWLHKSGLFKAKNAELIGTLRTGVDAPLDARVGIKDAVGIVSGPTFTGTGLNDLLITQDGNIPGEFQVKINTVDNYINSGNSELWSTPFQVGTNIWQAIAVNSTGRFVAVGDGGYISYSDDGITWVNPFLVGTNVWLGVTINSTGRFVAVGDDGYISYSDDGITWATPFQVGVNYWYNVAVNSTGRFVAVGYYGYISYSDDGITWVNPFQVGSNNWQEIAVNSTGRFVMVGNGGYISYSDDGITWATPFRVVTDIWLAIAVNSTGRFVVVGFYGYISYSDDGITWATPFQVGVVWSGNNIWSGVTINSTGRFVMVGNGGYISYSDDGITWVNPFQVGTNVWLKAIAVNSTGRFVAVGDGGYISYSLPQDSIIWTHDAGASWETDTLIPLEGTIPLTGFDIFILFNSAYGHTIGNYWDFTQGAMRGMAIFDSAGVEYFSASNGAIAMNSLNTGQGANLLYDMNQNVKTDSDVEFNSIEIIASEGVRSAGSRSTGQSFGGGTFEPSTVYEEYGTDYKFKKSGIYTIYFGLRESYESLGDVYAKIYKNGSPIGTERKESTINFSYYSENISVLSGDILSMYMKISMNSTIEITASTIYQNEEGES